MDSCKIFLKSTKTTDIGGNTTASEIIMRKIYGTTIFIGSSELETQYGKFTAYVFQDVIDIKYIFNGFPMGRY